SRTPTLPDDVADGRRPVIELRTAPTDFCFPTQNQTRHCYVRYPEYHRCVKAKDGDDRTECDKFQRYYGSLCPTDWVVEWNRQREEGIFPGPI
uniref:Cytochrome c oxidase subunit n=1 Tax=Setaria italica TaxID=4555 RepID=K4AJK6_SETIT